MDLVLALAHGYKRAQIEPFLRTFRRFMPSAHLHLFTGPHDLQFEGIDMSCEDVSDYLNAMADVGYRLELARYFLYRRYLRKHIATFDKILLTDTADIAFQGDPFADPILYDTVAFALEDCTIEKSEINSAWINNVYGEEVCRDIGMHTISCSGTTVGSAARVMNYVDLMCDQMLHRRHMLNPPFNAIGLDQGIHNYVVRVCPPERYALPHNHKIVSTLHYTPLEEMQWADDKLEVYGRAAPILHQFDRHPKIHEAIWAIASRL